MEHSIVLDISPRALRELLAKNNLILIKHMANYLDRLVTQEEKYSLLEEACKDHPLAVLLLNPEVSRISHVVPKMDRQLYTEMELMEAIERAKAYQFPHHQHLCNQRFECHDY